MFKIKRIIFENFKKFRNLDLKINDHINIIVGDNGTGKSSILQGIDLALSGSVSKIQTIGLENLINIDAVNECIANKDVELLPKLKIEIYFESDSDSPKNEFYFGEKNRENKEEYGIKLICEPREDFIDVIEECLRAKDAIFPYELYKVYHATFKNERFNSYKRPLKANFIDSSEINSKHAIRNTIKETYLTHVTDNQRITNRNNYNRIIKNFPFEGDVKEHGICVSSNLEDNLSIVYSGVHIENRGKGEINIIKISYALNHANDDANVILLEEPENHLAPYRMRGMIQDIINKSDNKQIFIVTHSNLITARLGLDNVIFLSEKSETASLCQLNKGTSDFFKKSPSNNLLQFILSKKVILVEGAAEFILMDAFYTMVTSHQPEQDDVWIISINGLSFPRYLQIAQIIHNKVAVVRDNDGNNEKYYKKYECDSIGVFYDTDINRYTFEKCIYDDNRLLCETVFEANNTFSRMMSDKAEAAYKLLRSLNGNSLNIPDYIRRAIEWIRK